jgi:hypothetical protein
LFADATNGNLRDQRILIHHVRRLLKDPRSDALVQNFAMQWLNLRLLDAVTIPRSSQITPPSSKRTCGGRRSCSCKRSFKRTAAFWTSSTATSPSSTSGWRNTMAFSVSSATTSGGSRSRTANGLAC